MGVPRDINDLGQVVGNDPHAWLWENGVVESVDPTGWAWGINDRSEVVGRNSDNHAALWIRDAQGVWQMSDLGTLGIGAAALDINNHGQIVGGFSINSETSHPFLWQDGTMLDLGILPNFDFSAADDINESGQAVGTAATTDYSEWRGFLWQQDTMWDLNDVVVSGPSLEIRGARGINESGQIAGWAKTPDAQLHAILLNPISPGDVDFDGDVDVWDFLELLMSWGDCPRCDTCPADVNGDCLVGINDLLILLSNWAP
jgi:probable HAF family extracellular repeat protein